MVLLSVPVYPVSRRFMPYLKFIAQNINQKEYRLLRGKAIECISLIGMCVPKEKVQQTVLVNFIDVLLWVELFLLLCLIL